MISGKIVGASEARLDNSEDATSKASPSVLPCWAVGTSLPSLVGLMNMMTRVSNRCVALVLLLAVATWLGVAVAPACAKENISDGFAGDPGDGWGIASGGSNERPTDGDNSAPTNTAVSKPTVVRHFGFALVPYFDGSGLHFLMINFNDGRAGSLK